jgi:hypothetical protein
VAPRQIAEDLGHAVAEVMKAPGDLVALGIVVPCECDGIPRYALTTSLQARHALDDVLHAGAGVQRAWTGSNGASPDTEAA